MDDTQHRKLIISDIVKSQLFLTCPPKENKDIQNWVDITTKKNITCHYYPN